MSAPHPAWSTLDVRRDASLVARVIRRSELRYADGGDPGSDRTAHVRAGSGLAWLGGELVVAQDDTSFLARLDPAKPGAASAIELDHVVRRRRVFEARLGNKKDKLDLEACAPLPDGRVLVVGSGSLEIRERLVVLSPDGTARIVDARCLYSTLRARHDFSGAELNVEGAAVVGGSLVLVNRGNGAPCEGREPIDALARLPLPLVLVYLDGGAAPPIDEVLSFSLGSMDGVRLTPTDVCERGGRLWFLAAAEASPNAIDDGEVVATAIGRIDLEARSAVLGALVDETGAPLCAKVEGLTWATPDGSGDRAFAVVDRDDPDAASELLEVQIAGA